MSVYGIDASWVNAIRAGNLVSPNKITMRSKGAVVDPESGQPVEDPTPDAIAGLIDLPCRKTPIIKDRPTGKEERQSTVATQFEGWHVTIFGYYPTITTDMIADVDGVLYDVESFEYDGHHTQTRLRLSTRKD